MDALVFEERDRRIAVTLAAGRSAVAESTNVTPQAHARFVTLARRFDAPVTVLRFPRGSATSCAGTANAGARTSRRPRSVPTPGS